jgi:hypothetical protein
LSLLQAAAARGIRWVSFDRPGEVVLDWLS